MKREIGPVDLTKDRTSPVSGGLWGLMFSKVSACFVIILRRSGMASGRFERRGHAPERARRRHYHVLSMMFLTCFGEGHDARGILIIDSYGFGGGGH